MVAFFETCLINLIYGVQEIASCFYRVFSYISFLSHVVLIFDKIFEDVLTCLLFYIYNLCVLPL